MSDSERHAYSEIVDRAAEQYQETYRCCSSSYDGGHYPGCTSEQIAARAVARQRSFEDRMRTKHAGTPTPAAAEALPSDNDADAVAGVAGGTSGSESTPTAQVDHGLRVATAAARAGDPLVVASRTSMAGIVGRSIVVGIVVPVALMLLYLGLTLLQATIGWE